MRRSVKVWAVAVAATLVMAGCGSGISEESSASGDDSNAAVDEVCESIGELSEFPEAQCPDFFADDSTDTSATDSSGTETSGTGSSGTEAAVLAEIDALCATTATKLEGLTDATTVPVNDLADLSAAMFDLNGEIDEIVTAWDSIETSDDETVIAINDIAAFLFEFSTQLFDIAVAAGDRDVQATSDALDALAAPDATAAEAGFQLFADQGATSCQVLAG